jgi:hypothetical protein
MNDGETTSVVSVNRANLVLSPCTTDEDHSVSTLNTAKRLPSSVDVQIPQDRTLTVVAVGFDGRREVAGVVALRVLDHDGCSRLVFGETASVDALSRSGEDDGGGVRVDL